MKFLIKNGSRDNIINQSERTNPTWQESSPSLESYGLSNNVYRKNKYVP